MGRKKRSQLGQTIDDLEKLLEVGKRFYQFVKQQTAPVGLAPGSSSDGDPYAILGMAPEMPFPEKKQRYRRLQFLVHPDRGGDTALASMINKAWAEICRREGKR